MLAHLIHIQGAHPRATLIDAHALLSLAILEPGALVEAVVKVVRQVRAGLGTNRHL